MNEILVAKIVIAILCAIGAWSVGSWIGDKVNERRQADRR
jgi:type II secretory pathway pseudopilin PulG